MKTLIVPLSIVLVMICLSCRVIYFFGNLVPYRDGEQIEVIVSVANQPTILGQTQSFSIYPDKRNQLFVRTAAYPEFFYGETIHLSGSVKTKALQNKRIVATIYFPSLEARSMNQESRFFSLLFGLRQKVIALFDSSLPPVSAALLLGIVFGIKETMPQSFVKEFQGLGLIHIIAASGMNVTMVSGFLLYAFSIVFKRRLAILLSIIGIIFYVLFAGLQASILRAGIMGIILLSSGLFGRQYKAVYGLIVAFMIMVWQSPFLLLDVGFGLSFLSTCGLLFIKPLFDSMTLLSGKLQKLFVWDDITTTTAAQIATLPILLGFGTYSLLSILVNAMVLWTIPYLMIVGGMGAILGLIFEPLGRIVLYSSLPFLFFLESVVRFLGQFIGEARPMEIPVSMVGGYYLVLVSGLVLLYRYKKTKFEARSTKFETNSNVPNSKSET